MEAFRRPRRDDPISLVLFDMDGVIADTADGHKRAWDAYLSRFGRRLTQEEFLGFFGTGNKELIPRLLPHLGLDEKGIAAVSDEKEALFRLEARGLLRTYPGFWEFLGMLDDAGVPAVVGSSANRANVDFVLGELGLAGRFAATVSADDVRRAKPAPDIFLEAARRGGAEPADCLVIEDSKSGLRAAAAAGIRAAALATTHGREELQGADFVAADFHELSRAVGPLLAGRPDRRVPTAG